MNKNTVLGIIACLLLCTYTTPMHADKADKVFAAAIGAATVGAAALVYNVGELAYKYNGLSGIVTAAAAGVLLFKAAKYLIQRDPPHAEDALGDAILGGCLLATTGLAGTVWSLCRLGRWLLS